MGRFLCRAPLPRSPRGSPSPPQHAARQNPRPLTREAYATQKKGRKKVSFDAPSGAAHVPLLRTPRGLWPHGARRSGRRFWAAPGSCLRPRSGQACACCCSQNLPSLGPAPRSRPHGAPGGCQQPQGNIEERSAKHDGVGVWGIKRLSRTRSTHCCCRVTLVGALRRVPALGGDLGKEGFRGPLAEAQQLARSKNAGNCPALLPPSSRDPESWS